MIKKFRRHIRSFQPKNTLIQIPAITNICICTKNERKSSMILSISNHEELMAVTAEPILITGRSDWQIKELDENTRELGICKHFMKQLTPEYLCYFVQELLQKKQTYLNEQSINGPVTLYMWFYYCPLDMGGRPFLCYDFISGYNPKLPFGGKYSEDLHVHTFMRKFLALKTKTTDSKKLYVFSTTLNKAAALGKDIEIRIK